MSGSRKSLKALARHFNPRAENDWSKDDSKFGQRMLEKMGWSKGQGVGRDNQGIAENIKLQMKFDNKGLGFKITDADHLLEIESNFAHLLSNLNQNFEEEQFNDCSPEMESGTQDASEHAEINMSHECETSEQHKTRKTKKKKAKIIEIVEDDDSAAARSTENDSSKSSTNVIPTDCSEIIVSEVTNNDSKRKSKSKSKKEMNKDAESAELSSTGIESSDCIGQIAPEKPSRKRKHAKKSKTTDDDSECTEKFSNGDDNYVQICEEDETRRTLDLIDMNARLEAESETAATPTHYSSKRRKCSQEEHIEPNSEEIDFKRERKRKKKSKLDQTDSNSVTVEVTTVQEDAVVDECSEETRSRRKSKTKRTRETPDDDSSSGIKCKKSNTQPNGRSTEETFCEEQKSPSSEAIGCESLSPPSASKMKEKTDVSYTNANRNRHYTTEDRKLSKAERIIMKARLMKKLRTETIVHDFAGSNISCISGYGNCANVKL